MNQNYNNPLVTYDEIIEAIKSIIECSLSSNYLDEYDYLNIKYESPSKIDEEEKLLINAIKSLGRSIDTTSKIVRRGLEKDLKSYEENLLKIETEYLFGQEKRKLAAQDTFITKLKEASLKIDSLFDKPAEEKVDNATADVDTNTVLSDFEKKVVSDFPVFFKEEISLANNESLKDAEEINNIVSHNYVATEELEDTKKNDRLDIIEKAIIKARELGDQNIIASLEKKYEEELKSDNRN